jgi:hypothetical protein
MSSTPTPANGWVSSGDYEFKLFDEPAKLEAAMKDRAKTGATARMVAGFCWPWSDPEPDGSLVPDVVIGKWKRPWNEKSPEVWKKAKAAPPPERHPYYLWATEPERIGEIGCIYSAQGFEFDYCGVILGNDLVWREGTGWVASRDASKDQLIARRKLTQKDLVRLLQHTYRCS